jgi:hypothetical protein
LAESTDVIKAFKELSEEEKKEAGAALAAGGQLPPPPKEFVGWLWLLAVGAFSVLMVGGAFLLYLLSTDDKSTEVIAPLVTGALGVLAGLLAPSPAAGGGGAQ